MHEYFTSLYQKARALHPELIDLSKGALASLDERHLKQYRLKRTIDFVVLTTTLSIAFGGISISLAMLWRLVAEISVRLAHLDYHQGIARVPGLWFGILAAVFAALTYFLLSPVIGRRMPISSIYRDVIWSDSHFVITAIIGVYVCLGVTIVLVASRIQIHPAVLSSLFRVWLGPLAIILSLAPFGIVLAGLVLLHRIRSKASTTEEYVCDWLLNTLADWPSPSTPSLDAKSRESLAKSIKKTSNAIRRLHFKSADESEEWAADQMKRAADNCLVCISWLYVPQAGTVEAIRMQMVGLANSFLTGHLHELPRRALGEEDGFKMPQRKQRVMRTISITLAVLAYCLIPIVIYF